MRIEKIQLAEYVTEAIRESEFVYFVTYLGVDVATFSDFRDRLSGVGASCQVLKNSYLSLALANNDIALADDKVLTGDTCVVCGDGDPAAAAKVVKEFSKECEFIQFKGGVMSGSYIDAKQAVGVADLPPLPVLQAQLLGVLNGPARSLATVLDQSNARIAYVLKAYETKLASE
jgi:large subunit ribosomal protein L10